MGEQEDILRTIMNVPEIPIIAIDGTVASGKGTIAALVAKHFGFNYLNSGAVFRLAAHLAIVHDIDINDHSNENLDRVVKLIVEESGNVDFVDKQVFYKGQDIWPLLSSQEAGNNAALISFYPPLRYAINDFHQTRVVSPGLVAEGRDMSTGVFPWARAKIYLDATVEARAKRRLKDEEKRNSGKTYEMLCDELAQRDATDKGHTVGALKLAPEALYIDTSDMTIGEVLGKCIVWCTEKGIVRPTDR
jgi:cytidylate kinase